MPSNRFLLQTLVWAALGVAGYGAPAPAQYFGRNKVQYKDFHFEVLKTEHFDVYFYPVERAAAGQAARLAERWYARLSKLLDHQLTGRQPLILYASHPDFEQTNAIPGELGEGTGGVTEVLKRRIVLPLAGPLAETNHVIGHELVHAFQFDIAGTGPARFQAAGRLPLWFIEGMAEYLSLGPVDPHTAMWLRDATERHKVPTVRQLSDPRYFPYRYGQAFWAFLAGHYGDGIVGQLLKVAIHSGDAERALAQVTGLPADSLSGRWRAQLEASYGLLKPAMRPPQAYGRPLAGGTARPGLNVAPAVSPDGSQVVYFSERGLFSIDLYLADARTGEVKRRITKTALDAHYQSLEFINSSGAWDAAGRRLAFGAVSGATAVLTVLDVAHERTEREIRLPEVGEIFNPTWSPDGRYVAFAALAGGFTDLFRYDLNENRLERLTNDAFADLEPAWSLDGRQIAFVTDRFSTSFGELDPGNYGLAVYDVATGAMRPLPGFADGKNIDPQWAPDGKSLYFISDHNGISNVYRLDLGSGARYQVTDLYTGVSGITSISPGLSVAGRTGRLVFSAYEASGYRLYAVDSAAVLAGRTPTSPPAAARPAVLPPWDRKPSELLAALQQPEQGLPGDTAFPVRSYHSRLSLDYVAPPTLGVGVSRFGTFVGGGTALYWSDMLGNSNLVTGLQANGDFQSVGGLVGYQNVRRRLNWGLVGQQVPFVTGGFAQGFGTVRGQPAFIQQSVLFRQTNREVAALTAYPFNPVQRVEFSAAFDNISFHAEQRTQAFSLQTGALILDSTETLPSPAAINLGSASLALIFDNSFFGATSPILGQRYRLETTPVAGTITFVNVLADYRRYVMPVRRFTLAGRLLHFGRYGGGAEDQRLTPLFLGYANLVRGYNQSSFSAEECPVSSPNCPVFDQLLGSRLLVGNLELRFPLLGVLGAGGGYYGAFPIEAAIFADGGLAWNKADQPSVFEIHRRIVKSTGVALRVNLFGFAIGEVDLVHPFDRPNKGTYFEFSLQPGF